MVEGERTAAGEVEALDLIGAENKAPVGSGEPEEIFTDAVTLPAGIDYSVSGSLNSRGRVGEALYESKAGAVLSFG